MKRIFTLIVLFGFLSAGVYMALAVYYDVQGTNFLVRGMVEMPEIDNVPGTPDSTSGRIYAYSDGLYHKDDAGTITNLLGTGTNSFELPLAAAFLDGTGVIGNDGTTAPGLAETDNIPAIVYASSAETTAIQWTFRVPEDYQSGLAFRMIMSSSVSASADQSIDWQVWVNDDNTGFDAAAIAQTAVSPAHASLDASNEVLTFTLDATGEAAISAGSFLTIDFFNAGSSDGTTEIKGIQAYYDTTT